MRTLGPDQQVGLRPRSAIWLKRVNLSKVACVNSALNFCSRGMFGCTAATRTVVDGRGHLHRAQAESPSRPRCGHGEGEIEVRAHPFHLRLDDEAPHGRDQDHVRERDEKRQARPRR